MLIHSAANRQPEISDVGELTQSLCEKNQSLQSIFKKPLHGFYCAVSCLVSVLHY